MMHHVKHCDIQAFMTCHHEDVNDVVVTLELLESHRGVEIDEVFLSLLLSISHCSQFHYTLFLPSNLTDSWAEKGSKWVVTTIPI